MKRNICFFLSIILILTFVPFFSAAEADGGATETVAEVTTTTTTETTASSETTETTTTTAAPAIPPAPIINFDGRPTSAFVEVTITEAAPLNKGDTIQYRTDDTSWENYTKPLSIDVNCTIFAKVTLANGNESPISHAEITCIDKMPPTPPEILADNITWVNSFVDVSVVSGSDLESGVLRNEYRLGENGTWLEYSSPVKLTEAAVFYARTLDMAGNVSSMASKEINNFDVTPPDISAVKVYFTSDIPPVLAESGAFGKYYRCPITVTIDGAKDNQSGLAAYQYQFAESSAALKEDGWLEYNLDARPEIASDFCGYVYVRAVDHAGNISYSTVSEGVVLDAAPPVISEITLTPSSLTSGRVAATFSVTDNYWLESITYGEKNIGTYDPSITIFRNGEYTITASDKAGNIAKSTFTVSNIDSTPFSLLSVFEQLDENSFTPSSWKPAAESAEELKALLADSKDTKKIEHASEDLTAALEALVSRGDGTMALELIEKTKEYDKALYTESSWLHIDNSIEVIKACLDDPESTQADVDTARRTLEHAIAELQPLADFTAIDRLITQCETIDRNKYDPEKFEAFLAALEAAKALSRTDSSQEAVDSVYYTLLDSMNSMRIVVEPVKEMPVVGYVIMGLLVIFILTLLFILLKGKRHRNTEPLEDEYTDDYTKDYDDTPENEPHSTRPNIGDICFTDSEDDSDGNF